MQINGLLLQNILLITSSQPEVLVRNSRDGTHFGIGLFGWEKKRAQKVRSLLCPGVFKLANSAAGGTNCQSRVQPDRRK
jgi:hypothetical protein